MVRIAALCLFTVLVTRAPVSAAHSDHRDGPALTTSTVVAVAHSRPQNPAPEPNACPVHLGTLSTSRSWPSAWLDHAVRASLEPAQREHRGMARVHIPRRRIPRLRDDVDDP